MNTSASEFGFRFKKLFFAFTCVSGFRVVFRKLMIDLGTLFGFYSGNCFVRVVVLFNCVCENPVGVNCPRQTLASADLFCVCMHVYKNVPV